MVFWKLMHLRWSLKVCWVQYVKIPWFRFNLNFEPNPFLEDLGQKPGSLKLQDTPTFNLARILCCNLRHIHIIHWKHMLIHSSCLYIHFLWIDILGLSLEIGSSNCPVAYESVDAAGQIADLKKWDRPCSQCVLHLKVMMEMTVSVFKSIKRSKKHNLHQTAFILT